ncbi:filamentous hemagglutinin N-terminal domain-containing protein, partial [Acidithiobacillus sp.]|uniref:two-partner secretion domain-containing protein n=1 Tax=Acidithiobacillus sp. TaxID=1872118 RepID=UPI0025BA30B3
MNHIYRLVWSASHRMLVAVSEIAGYRRGGAPGTSRRRKGAARRVDAGVAHAVTDTADPEPLPHIRARSIRQVVRWQTFLLGGGIVLFAPLAFALPGDGLPTGGQVVSGQATLSQSGHQLTITQTSSKAILNWQSFGIGSGQTVDFQQPNAASVALNNVTGSNPSEIFGNLEANGQVFLVNPNGITFAPGAQVNVGGILASTLPISNADFLKGNYTFSGSSTATVDNAGTITAAPGGYVAFIGNQVNNTGSLIAPGGTVALGAGSLVDLTLQGNSLLHFAVSGSVLQALAENGGLIQANGGTVILSGDAKNALLQTVVNNTGEIEAQTVGTEDGHIALLGGSSGTVVVGGTLDASAPNGGNGGSIDTSGAQVQVSSNANITTAAADGKTGNWTIDPASYTISSNASSSSTNSITPTFLESELSTKTRITISSTSNTGGSGDIYVDSPVSWSKNSLILDAYNNIVVNQPLTATGTAGLTLEYGMGSTNGVIGGTAASVTLKAPINLGTSSTFSTELGSKGVLTAYTIVDSQSTLQSIGSSLAGDYALGTNLSLTGSTPSGDFTPIGTSFNNAFTGTFDGLGHTIAGLTIDTASSSYVGLFGFNKGTIENVGLMGVSVTGSNDVGGLVGYNNGSITDGYWDTTTSGTTPGVGAGTTTGVTGISTTSLAAALPTGFGSTVWGNGGNQTTPYLLANASFDTVSGQVYLGTDTSATPTAYGVILTQPQLQNINQNLGAKYVLGTNLSLTGSTPSGDFTPIGTS